jgi:hypothetical protein
MFINTKKTISIKSDNGTVFAARAGWIGEIPKWVEEHWYFKALCKDGSITSIVSSRDKEIQKAVESQPENPESAEGDQGLPEDEPQNDPPKNEPKPEPDKNAKAAAAAKSAKPSGSAAPVNAAAQK